MLPGWLVEARLVIHSPESKMEYFVLPRGQEHESDRVWQMNTRQRTSSGSSASNEALHHNTTSATSEGISTRQLFLIDIWQPVR
jgi:hypothetical protein